MKFAKELERDAVPEWRIKYLNYKAGKKYVKAVARALTRANATPRRAGQLTPSYFTAQTLVAAPDDGTVVDDGSSRHRAMSTGPSGSRPIPTAKGGKGAEDDALTSDGNNLQYGSFVPTPPLGSPAVSKDKHNQFELPAPAMPAPPEPSEPSRPLQKLHKSLSRTAMNRSASMAAVPTLSDGRQGASRTFPRKSPGERPLAGSPSQLRRLFSHSGGIGARDRSRVDIGMHSFDLVREREAEFYEFMDSELDKVDSFYKLKEEQAGQRLAILRDQLHEMRNRRIHEVADEQRRDGSRSRESDDENSPDKSNGWVQPIKAKIFPPGPNSKAFSSMPRTPLLRGGQGDASRDYIRRPEDDDVSYRTAKRKLKLALQEFYRGLELLKSYALLNRTGFRKINKKFDKAVNARPTYRFMNERVNKALFVNSDAVEGHIKTVEDLYARYFERGNHKLAAGKLRSLSKKPRDESGSSFLNGFLIGTGIVFTVQGLIYGAQLLFDEDPKLRTQTSYLMQIYGGYFLMLLLFSLFCINCFVWTRNKVNYPFIFEFDQRHHVDWRRLSEFPSFFLLLFGIFMWMNFSRYGSDDLYLYYPVVLIGITTIVILLPFPVLAFNSRKWFAYSHGRLLLAGIYPVEFRDFFLGDIYCSLTYAMANIELFFCLYANGWNNPVQCNSNHSRALGFLTTLPPIWRFLQCIRRYRDTRNIFPHLVNCGKYAMSITAAVTLSVYRIDNTRTHLALLITFSLINSIYCSIWDLFMDFSLLQTQSRHFCLRDILALKSRWPYYTIMVIDPILRFAWIFYAIFTHNTQHSTVVSFLVSLMEVIRRGMWALLRVENEHCANVSQYKASRDVPLPYRIEPLMDRASAEPSPVIRPENRVQQEQREQREQDPEGMTTSSTAVGSSMGTLRRRADTTHTRTFSKILAEAHKQDFEKKRKPATQAEDAAQNEQSDDDDDDDEADMDLDVREAQHLRRRDTDDS